MAGTRACENRLVPLRGLGLALGELEALAGAGLTGLFAFLGARIALEVSGGLERGAELRVHLLQGAGDAVRHGAGLTGDTAAVHVGRDVEFVLQLHGEEGLVGLLGKILVREVAVKVATVGDELAGAFSDADAGDGGLATAGADKKRWFLRSWVRLADGNLDGVLRLVGVVGTAKDTQLGQHGAGEFVLGKHALDGVLDKEFRTMLAHLLEGAVALTANETGKEHILVLLFLDAGEGDFVGVDDDDVVAGVHVGRVGSLMTAAKEVGGFHRETTEHLALGIDKMPLGLNRLFFGEEGFHV